LGTNTEPDYRLTIIETNDGFVAYEGGVVISVAFNDKLEAENWAEFHRRWCQPLCCCCGSAATRPDDPWEAYSVDRYGPDWMHASCMKLLNEA
jgi:hypothetical protein